MAKGKQVAKHEEEPTALTTAVYDAEDYGAGFEDFGQDDIAIPFLNVLQKGSPAVDEDNASFIKGAKAGMIMNSVTSRLYDKETGVVVIPVHRIHQYIEWIPRSEGGGFVAAHEVDSPVVTTAKQEAGGGFGDLETPEGNELKETFNVFVLVVGEDGDFETAILPFSSTQIRAYKKWMTTCRSIILRDADGRRFPAPMFAHQFRIRTKFQENNKGTWYGMDIGFAHGNAEASRMTPDDELFQAAKGFRELILSGAAKANYDSHQDAGTEVRSGGYTESADGDDEAF
jgi:hypothetical protein